MAGARSSGIVVVRKTAASHVFLLLRVYRSWDFPKGLIESDEDALQAAIRETQEETGLCDLAFSWGYEFAETLPYTKGKIARYYLAEATRGEVNLGVNPLLGRAEHHEYRWVTADTAALLLPPRLKTVFEWARRRIAQTDPRTA